MIRRLLSLVMLFHVFVLTPTTFAARRRSVSSSPHNLIRIGGLFSLTGDATTLGTASEAALNLAIHDINVELEALNSPYRAMASIEDTGLSAHSVLDDLKDLDASNVRFVIGPQSSAEAAAILPYANENQIVLVSQGSTASSLAIAGDYLFRLAPNDRLEGAAQSALMHADGIDTIVPIWRNDAGNNGLHNSTSNAFVQAGGNVLAGSTYDPATTDFTENVNAIATQVRNARTANPSAHIAVYIASFEEAVDIMRLARLDNDLGSIPWYGGDGVAQSQALLNDASVAAFAKQVSFTAPNVGLDETARDTWEHLSDEIETQIGFKPDAYSLSVYDAAWVAAIATIEAQNEQSVLRDAFERNVNRYFGATGATALDAAGDRKIGNFDFWTMQEVGGTLQWVRTSQYTGGHISR
jgi:branched-chain amino acid transport system substrate-binding protein